MAELTLKSKVLFRKDSSANWSTHNPILGNGEPAWDSTVNRFKIGNGTNAWSDLDWAAPNPSIYQDKNIIWKDTEYHLVGIQSMGPPNNSNITFSPGQVALRSNDVGLYWAGPSLYADTQGSLGSIAHPWTTAYISSYLISPSSSTASSTLPRTFSIQATVPQATATYPAQNSQLQLVANRTYYANSSASDHKMLFFASGDGNDAQSAAGTTAPGVLYPSGKVKLGRNLDRFTTAYFNELDLRASSDQYSVIIKQAWNGPSDHGLTITGSYAPSQSLHIAPDTGWIGKGSGMPGVIYFKTTGISLGPQYGFSVDFKLDSSASGKGEILPKYSSTIPGKFSLGAKDYSFSSIYGRNLILNSQSVSSDSDIDTFSKNILCLDDEITFSVWKSFTITGFSYDNKTFTLDSVTGLEIGDVYSTAITGIAYENYGQITAISGNTVTVSAIPSGSFDSYLNGTPSSNHMCWYIPNKPDVGTTSLSNYSEVSTSNFIMVTNAKANALYNSKKILNNSNTFCFGDGLLIPTNKTYSIQPVFKIGKYDNDSLGNYPFVIGWGTDDSNRKNIFYIDTSGRTYAGSVYPNTSASTTNYIGSSGNKWDYGYIVNMNTTTTFLSNSWATLPSDTSQRALCYKNYYNTSVGDIDAITTPGLYTLRTGITGGPYCSATGSSGSAATSYFTVLCMATDNGSGYRPMIGIKENDNNLYVKGSTTGNWKRIGWGYGTSAPSGTANTGDIYIQYEA